MQKAIEASGYPLQSLAADIILDVLNSSERRCFVQEEWSFIDSELDIVRQLDSLISCDLPIPDIEDRPSTDPTSYLRFTGQMLVECKQSDLPIVFFLRETDPGNYPHLAGLPHSELKVLVTNDRDETDGFALLDSAIKANMSTATAVGLHNLPFYRLLPTAIAMAKGRRKGSGLELSGDEVFRGLSIPLSKALQHFMQITRPSESRNSHHIRVVFPVAVLRAPIVGVKMSGGKPVMTALPWVRVVLSEPRIEDTWERFSQPISFDVVHIDMLKEYAVHALTATEEIARRMKRLASPIITGFAICHTPDSSQSSNASAGFEDILEPFLNSEKFSDWISGRIKLETAETTQSGLGLEQK